ncbi:hypothetical protein CU048_08795 [Beijerinckiaceae bacterium]|nr:hypothetical protein CU048_08795 [Beijerinckiaceae bacterium]
MSNIMFFILHEVGSINASLQLANDLKTRGHQVTYVGLADSEELIKANGFDFVTLFESHFPKQSVQTLTGQGTLRRGLSYLRWLPRKYFIFRRFVDYLIAGGDEEFFAVTDKLRPDLILFSGGPYVEWPALMSFSRGIKCVYLCSTLSLRRGTGLPPVSSAMIPRYENSLWQSARVWLAWKKFNFENMLHFFGHRKCTRQLAAKYGIDKFTHDTVYSKDASVTLSEIIPFHPDFDFLSRPLPGQYFIGASICLERREEEFPWHQLDTGKPLAYCALGTYLWYGKKKYVRFFRAVLDAALAMPEWQWVLATGGSLHWDEIGTVPKNVLVVKNAPQIGLLKRASVMITHGGANTVKECILLGVPMVIFPLGGDHPGIAARAIYHGLAMRGEFTKIDGAKLRSLIRAATTNPYIRIQLRLMQTRFIDVEAAKLGVKLIESLLASGRCGDAEVGLQRG